jgi:nucleotidyltransferase/DNA polymerase involved in DNA repair
MPRPEATIHPAPASSCTPSSTFACLWIADLPTWTLERLDASLEDRAVIAVDGARVGGANTAAHWTGVRVGDTVSHARGLCPTVVVRSLEPSVQSGVWADVLEDLNRFTPWLESPRAGLVFASGLTPHDADTLARALRLRIGLSGSRDSAFLAALSARERQCRHEPHQHAFLERVPLRILRGAGIELETLQRLHLFGLETLGDLRERVSKAQLERQFPESAERLWSLAHGSDTRTVPIYTPPPSFSERFEYDTTALEPSEIIPALEDTVRTLTARLTRHLAGAFVLRLETAAGLRSSRVHLKDFTRDLKALLRAARKALLEAQGGLEVTAFTVTLTDLSKPIPVQDSLFAVLERPGVREAVQRVHRRFPDRLGRLRITNARAYLPERRFRFVPLTGEERAKPRKGKR